MTDFRTLQNILDQLDAEDDSATDPLPDLWQNPLRPLPYLDSDGADQTDGDAASSQIGGGVAAPTTLLGPSPPETTDSATSSLLGPSPPSAQDSAVSPPAYSAADGSPDDGITVTAQSGVPFTDADRDLLTRMIYTEGAGNWKVPGLFEALGSTAINRIGDPYYHNLQSLQDVLTDKGQFQGVNREDLPLWQQATAPTTLNGGSAQAFARAQQVAGGLLAGNIPDNTGGATSFFSSSNGLPVGRFKGNMSVSIGKNGEVIPPFMGRSRSDIGPFTFLRINR